MERGAKYDWDEGNKGHIAQHGIEPHEVEEVLAGFTIPDKTHIDPASGEERFVELGVTKAGRVLLVVWTLRGERTRPVTAWPADRKRRKEYYQTLEETL
jgi:uncharacterized DUF497 family protein